MRRRRRDAAGLWHAAVCDVTQGRCSGSDLDLEALPRMGLLGCLSQPPRERAAAPNPDGSVILNAEPVDITLNVYRGPW